MTGQACPSCAEPLAGQRYCEACGRDLVTGEAAPPPPALPPELAAPAPAHWLSSAAEPGPCTSCGAAEIGPEGYCEHCGYRRAAGRDHAELDLGTIAAVTDRGRHRPRNEDAAAIGFANGRSTAIAVVCDGVSASARADDAAQAAVDAGMTTLLAALADKVAAAEATVSAARAAADAVARLAGPETRHTPPSCTYVSAIVSGGEIVIGWIGDSRAYWLADALIDNNAADGSARLTADDSLAGQLAAAGVPTVDSRRGDPRAFALIRWLGADAGDTEPHVITLNPPSPGRVLLCTDGLSRYLADPIDLAAAAVGGPLAAARTLTQLALDAGGADNIAVAILPYSPPEPGGQS